MAKGYRYFNRDISWLSYDRRVLESATEDGHTLSERLNFVSYHSSNLDEFYSVRVALYRKAAYGGIRIEEVSNATATLQRINMIVSGQMLDASEIIRTFICREMRSMGIDFHYGERATAEEHRAFVKNYFEREALPYLQPVLLDSGIYVFLRNNRPYFAIKMHRKTRSGIQGKPTYAVVQLPINELPRFVELPKGSDGLRHVMFLDDIIRHGLQELFPGYEIEGVWSIKLSRDADLGISDDFEGDIAEEIRDNLVNRKTGTPSGFYHDIEMPRDLLLNLKKTLGFAENEMVACGRYLNLHQLSEIKVGEEDWRKGRGQIVPARLRVSPSVINVVEEGDLMLHFPYESFDYVIRLFNEAARDETVCEILVTQYRVATNSAVVSSLIAAAKANKRVTVFVELKARFDERNNLIMAEKMKAAGIKIIYGMTGFKVHAKIALIRREGAKSIAYVSTGNFNEQTARSYTDHGLLTSDTAITQDLVRVFEYMESNAAVRPKLGKLLVSQINMEEKLRELIGREREVAKRGGDGRIVLKMNGIQYRGLINELYEASMDGVKITLIVRGVCCIVPEQSYSTNIEVYRLVDNMLEHGRIWAFGKDGERGLYTSSSDWLNRNFNKRIEVVAPIDNVVIRRELIGILKIMMSDNTRLRRVDAVMNNCMVERRDGEREIRAQEEIYNFIDNAEQ